MKQPWCLVYSLHIGDCIGIKASNYYQLTAKANYLRVSLRVLLIQTLDALHMKVGTAYDCDWLQFDHFEGILFSLGTPAASLLA